MSDLDTVEYSNIEKRLLTLSFKGDFDREDCSYLYRKWALGSRLVNAIVRFSMSKKREITIQDAPPEAVELFEKTAIQLKQDKIIARTARNARIYGQSVMIAQSKDIGIDKPLTYKDVQNSLAFIAFDPLATTGTIIDQNPNSIRYLRPYTIKINSKEAHEKRATVLLNGDPIYLAYEASTFTYGGRSVYDNMADLIQSWVRSIVSFRRMATKASSIVVKGTKGGKMSGVQADAEEKSLQLVKAMQNTGASYIGKDEAIEFFSMTGTQEVKIIIDAIKEQITLALDDTPIAILFDKDLSNGLSEGTEDMKAVMIAVDSFREDMLAPLYEFSDPYVMMKAWSDGFCEKIKNENPEKYDMMTPTEMREMWKESFTYEWGNLYPEPENVKVTTDGIKLDNLLKAQAMGVGQGDLTAELKEQEIFKNEMDVTETPLTAEERINV